jgi:REP element-mobilizing transposase RayT
VSSYLCLQVRKKLLVGQLKEDMRSILLNITSNSDFEIEVFESDLDHIHFLIRYIPRLSITSIVRKLKQESTYHIWHSPHRSFYSSIFGRRELFGQMGILFALLVRLHQILFVNTSSHRVSVCRLHPIG